MTGEHGGTACAPYFRKGEGAPLPRGCLLLLNPPPLKRCWRDPTPARERCKAERFDLLTHFVSQRPTRIRRFTLQQRGDSENQWALLQIRRARATAATAAHPSKGTPKHPRGEAPAQHPTPEANWAAWPATALLLCAAGMSEVESTRVARSLLAAVTIPF